MQQVTNPVGDAVARRVLEQNILGLEIRVDEAISVHDCE